MTRKFTIGVMKYLTWEQTHWIDKWTCTHHLWTIPVFLFCAGTELTWDSFTLSVYIVVIHVLLSRWLTPHHIQIVGDNSRMIEQDGKNNHRKKEDLHSYRYLNVNLSHELWQDITLPFLQISKDQPPCWRYLFRLLWRWQLFNALVFIGILRPLSRFISSHHNDG